MSSERGPDEYLRAVVYVVADGEEDRWQRACIRWCEDQQYEIVALVVDTDDAPRWVDALRMIVNGEADVIVLGDWSQLRPGRVPRAEVAGSATGTAVPRQRRPRAVRQ